MPRIDLLPVPLHDPLEPYRFEFDNVPLKKLIRRQEAINNAVEVNNKILVDAIGTQGTVANRLNQSIEPNGNLKFTAIDDANHNIGAHRDGAYDGNFFVRMLQEERNKLETVSENATDLTLQFDTISTTVIFESGLVNFINSDSIQWNVAGPNRVLANLTFPTDAVHKHVYDLEPVDYDIISPNRKKFKTTSVSTPFIEESLRVYVNGVRLSAEESIYTPLGLDRTLTLLKFTPDHENGILELDKALTEEDVIRIDFDIAFI